jgi:hypothetical protein
VQGRIKGMGRVAHDASISAIASRCSVFIFFIASLAACIFSITNGNGSCEEVGVGVGEFA